VKTKYAASAFTGEGARRPPGRWNNRDIPMVYTAGSISLAVLEMLVHLKKSDFLTAYSLFRIEIPSADVHTPDQLPVGWSAEEYASPVPQFGTDWFLSGRSCALQVPSAIVPAENNFLLNPTHPKFPDLVIGEPEPFSFDPRLLKG
jgi:RES domain-containing protein